MFTVLFDATTHVNAISSSFGHCIMPAPARKPAAARPPMYWDKDAQTFVSTVSEADLEWARLNLSFAAEIEAADREQSQLDFWVDRLYDELQAALDADADLAMGRV